MSTAALAQTILTFAAIVGVGALLRAVGLLNARDSKPLNAVIVYVGLPAFIFRAVYRAELGPDLWRVVLLSWLVFVVVLAAALLLSKIRRMGRAREGAFLLVSTLGNTGYIGYPVTAALLGTGAVPLAVFSDVFGTVFALVFVGLPIAARLGHAKNEKLNLAKELLTFPAFVALIAGLAFQVIAHPLGVQMPEMVSNGLEMLASLVAPLIMLSVGIALKPRSVARAAADVALVGGLRLALAPVAALLIGNGMLPGHSLLAGQALQVGVLQAGMPAMMLSLVVGERFGLDTDFIASAIFVTTLFSAVTIPLVQSLVF